MKILSTTIQYLLLATLTALGGVLMLTLVPFAGMEAKIVQSGSMEPSVKTGSMVFVNTMTEGVTYQPGDVITFLAEQNAGEEVPTTHRVVSVSMTEGKVMYQTKGDANDAADVRATVHDNVVGRVVFSLPVLGYLIDFAKTPLGFLALIGFPALYIVFGECKKIWLQVRRMCGEEIVTGLFILIALGAVLLPDVTQASVLSSEYSAYLGDRERAEQNTLTATQLQLDVTGSALAETVASTGNTGVVHSLSILADTNSLATQFTLTFVPSTTADPDVCDAIVAEVALNGAEVYDGDLDALSLSASETAFGAWTFTFSLPETGGLPSGVGNGDLCDGEIEITGWRADSATLTESGFFDIDTRAVALVAEVIPVTPVTLATPLAAPVVVVTGDEDGVEVVTEVVAVIQEEAPSDPDPAGEAPQEPQESEESTETIDETTTPEPSARTEETAETVEAEEVIEVTEEEEPKKSKETEPESQPVEEVTPEITVAEEPEQ